jgi:hypothetical protein
MTHGIASSLAGILAAHSHTGTYSLLHAYVDYTNVHIDELGALDAHEREGALGGNRLSKQRLPYAVLATR